MLLLWALLSAVFLPLPILDTRITAYQKQLASDNCSMQDRLVLTSMMEADMRRRRAILEGIDDTVTNP